VAFVDNNFAPVDYEQVIETSKIAKCVISYTPNKMASEVKEKYKPRLTAKLYRRPEIHDYLLFW